jgi:hypothetical protein
VRQLIKTCEGKVEAFTMGVKMSAVIGPVQLWFTSQVPGLNQWRILCFSCN